MTSINIFDDAYNLCAKQLNKYPSMNFKKYIDELYPEKFFDSPFKKNMISGYFFRTAEGLIKTKNPDKPDDYIQKILKSKKNDYDKIEQIANYLDNHDKVGLPDKIVKYSLIPFNETKENFEIYGINFIKDTRKEIKIKKDDKEEFIELFYRVFSFGYLYKLSEEFIEINKK